MYFCRFCQPIKIYNINIAGLHKKSNKVSINRTLTENNPGSHGYGHNAGGYPGDASCGGGARQRGTGAGGLGGGNFWTGAGVGGLLGYMMGNRNNTGKIFVLYMYVYIYI